MPKPSVKPPVIFLMGPTASGKTAAAVELVKHFRCEIISVDSALVYRGMNIGTAKPDIETLLAAPHRLIDIRDPAEPYSAGDFRRDAFAAIAEITAAGRVPLLVGGTMLYYQALTRLDDLPEADPSLRTAIEARAAAEGWEQLHAELAETDPAAAERIHPNDAQRIGRALELIALTGQAQPAWEDADFSVLPYSVLPLIWLPAERARLHAQIAQRLDAMFAEGFVEEVESLRQRGDLHADLPAIRAVGYRQVWSHLHGEYGLAEAKDRSLFATRQLAKRQLTWLRRLSKSLGEKGAEIDPFEKNARHTLRAHVDDFLHVSD